MYIRKYGIKLVRINETHLETVRHMRLLPQVREQMFFQEHISSQDQRAWFETVNNIYNYYFLIEVDGEDIGVIFGKDIDFALGTSCGGIFIGHESFIHTPFPVYASIIMLDLTFNIFDLQSTQAEIRNSNNKQLHYNRMLGFSPLREEGDKIIMALSRSAYSSNKISSVVRKIKKDKQRVNWKDIYFEESDLKSLHLYTDLPPNIQQQVDLKLTSLQKNSV